MQRLLEMIIRHGKVPCKTQNIRTLTRRLDNFSDLANTLIFTSAVMG